MCQYNNIIIIEIRSYDQPFIMHLVHELTPYNIKVVGAVGDSVTVSLIAKSLLQHLHLYCNILQAGFGAKAKYIWEALTEYRGVSWRYK